MMGKARGITRRSMLGAPAALLLAAATGSWAAQGRKVGGPSSRTLVAYFTRSGNTRVIAGQLHRELPADLFEILPAQPYPEDYEATVAQAARERDLGFEPPLASRVTAFADYDTVYLGFPVWGETTPSIIRSFLKAHDLSGKSLRPFITHGGYGAGSSIAVLRSHAGRARIAEPFVMEADQERRTMLQVRGWMASKSPQP
jgi:flavodoxin